MKAHSMHDWQLLNEYVEQDSQVAFTTLVERHINLVYSVCLREVRDADLAHDVTQVVFLLLAKKASVLRKAAAFRSGRELTGWLYKTACFACKDALKQERRRQHHEQQAAEEIMHQAQIENREMDWADIEPTLHAALNTLGWDEREAVLMRFFQKKSLKEVGTSLGISEDAARMRVSRALDKLRIHFKRRGFALSAATLSALISSHAVQAAPAPCLAAAAGLGSYFATGTSAVATGSGALVGAQSAVGKASVHALFEGVSRAILLGQIKVATAVFIGTVALGSGVTQVVRRSQAPSSQPVRPLRSVMKAIPTPSATLPVARPVAMPRTEVKVAESKALFPQALLQKPSQRALLLQPKPRKHRLRVLTKAPRLVHVSKRAKSKRVVLSHLATQQAAPMVHAMVIPLAQVSLPSWTPPIPKAPLPPKVERARVPLAMAPVIAPPVAITENAEQVFPPKEKVAGVQEEPAAANNGPEVVANEPGRDNGGRNRGWGRGRSFGQARGFGPGQKFPPGWAFGKSMALSRARGWVRAFGNNQMRKRR